MAGTKERFDLIDERLHKIETALSLEVTKPPSEIAKAWSSITSWTRQHKKSAVAVVGVVLAAGAIIATLSGWTYNGHIESQRKVFEASVDSRVNEILSKPGGIAETVATASKTAERVDTSLNDLKPFIHDVVDHQFEGASRLSAQALSERLPAVNNLLAVAKDEQLPLERGAASVVGKNLTLVNKDAKAYWPTAGRLISATFKEVNLRTSTEVNCFTEAYPPTYATTSFVNSAVGWSDCTLNLDDLQGFTSSFTYVARQQNWLARDEPLELRLRRVKIVYRGGQPIPFARLVAENCTFEFSLPVAPAGNGRALVEALLSNFTEPSFTVALPKAASSGS